MNIFLGIRVEKAVYFPFEIFIGIYTAYYIKYASKGLVAITIGYFLPYVFIKTYFVEYPAYHIFYVFSLILKILFISIVVNMEVDGSIYLKCKRVVFSFLSVTLLFSIIHLFLGIHSPAPGWLWPINISIQELALIIIYVAFILYGDYKKNILLFFMFFILLFFRGSGKTSLSLICLIPIIIYILRSFPSIKSPLKYFPIIYSALGLFGILLIVSLYSSTIVTLYHSISTIAADKIDFYKRLSLIYEAFYYLLTPTGFFTGAGFGVVNYLSEVDSLLDNSPQILPLTIMAYGGVIFYIYYFVCMQILVLNLTKKTKRVDSHIYAIVMWIVILLFMTTHEYFNNPFLYISLFVFIVLLKSREKCL
ncbi:hypothetical protein H4N55_11985 [Aeromonas veronii]|uniref:hypothetical protein n=1 Tax=Aeromonas veronii TaxID=654 RepID=UPI00188D09B3|nr:hypothetical protein [Aeromonas veronii]MBF3237316.1 hypothetical protein [Aeromonas veronii]